MHQKFETSNGEECVAIRCRFDFHRSVLRDYHRYNRAELAKSYDRFSRILQIFYVFTGFVVEATQDNHLIY